MMKGPLLRAIKQCEIELIDFTENEDQKTITLKIKQPIDKEKLISAVEKLKFNAVELIELDTKDKDYDIVLERIPGFIENILNRMSNSE